MLWQARVGHRDLRVTLGARLRRNLFDFQVYGGRKNTPIDCLPTRELGHQLNLNDLLYLLFIIRLKPILERPK